MAMSDSLAREEVLPRVRGRFGRDYLYVESTPSTQLLLPPDAAEGAVVVAGEQTAGLFSLQLRPGCAASGCRS
jgi:hypothetical protein